MSAPILPHEQRSGKSERQLFDQDSRANDGVESLGFCTVSHCVQGLVDFGFLPVVEARKMHPRARIQKELKSSAYSGTPCLRSTFLMNRANIRASSLANAHVILEAAKTLPSNVRNATHIIRTIRTVLAALDFVA